MKGLLLHTSKLWRLCTQTALESSGELNTQASFRGGDGWPVPSGMLGMADLCCLMSQALPHLSGVRFYFSQTLFPKTFEAIKLDWERCLLYFTTAYAISGPGIMFTSVILPRILSWAWLLRQQEPILWTKPYALVKSFKVNTTHGLS